MKTLFWEEKKHRLFLYKICTKCIEKVSKTEIILTSTEKKMNETLIFFKTVPHQLFSTLIPARFQLVEVPLKFFFWYGVKLHHHISFNVLHILKSLTLVINFQFRKQDKVTLTVRFGKCCTCSVQCFTKDSWSKSIEN